jgi:hypothetical protein
LFQQMSGAPYDQPALLSRLDNRPFPCLTGGIAITWGDRRVLGAYPHPMLDEALAFDRHLADRALWVCDAIGRYERPRLETAELGDWEEIVLASDGARVTVERRRTRPVLAGLRDHERETGYPGNQHDDVTVLRVRRAS